MPKENARVKIVFEVRSLASAGHWRNGRLWYNTWTEVEESEISDSMRLDPRIEIKEVEVEEYPEEEEE
jgi:hypothetical protein